MALTNIKGLIQLPLDPGTPLTAGSVAFTTGGLMDATGERICIVGEVWHPTQKTGSMSAIRRVHFRCGAVTFNAASRLRVSLQNLSLTVGPPQQPDGTQDQFVDLATLTANAMNNSGVLSADRAVNLSNDSLGDADSRWLAVVFQYQVFTAADSIIINGIAGGATATGVVGNTGPQLIWIASWANISNAELGNVILECADGTFAFLEGCGCYSAVSSVVISSTGAIRRAGYKFRFPVEVQIDRFMLMGQVTAGADGRLVLYGSDGTTEERSVDVDANAVNVNNAANRQYRAVFTPFTCLANTYYRAVWVASTTTAITVPNMDVGAVGHMDGLNGGLDWHWTQHDGTSWADTTTRRPNGSIGISGVHNGAGGGGLLTNPGMSGGMRG